MRYDLSIVQLRETAAQFRASLPVPEASQLCIEVDTGRAFVGDGTTVITALQDVKLTGEERKHADLAWDNMRLSDDRDELGSGGGGSTTPPGMCMAFNDAAVSGDPGAGAFAFNSTSIGSITKLYVSDIDYDGASTQNWLATVNSGTAKVGKASGGSVIFNVTRMIDRSGYKEFDVQNLFGTLPSAGTHYLDFGPTVKGVSGVQAISSNTTVDSSLDGYVLSVTTGSSTITITLPSASTSQDVSYWIRKSDTGTGTVITSPATGVLSANGDCVQLVSDGTSWLAVSGVSAPTQRTGATIAFDTSSVYNTPSTPSSAPVSFDLSGAVRGSEVVAYFNHSSEPSWPAGAYKLGVWYNGALNMVRFLYLSDTEISVEINSNNVTANIGHIQDVVKTTVTTRNSTATLAADPDLKVAMLANKTYMIRGRIWGVTNATPDFKYRWVGPASPTRFRGIVTHTGAGTSAPTNGLIAAYSASDQVFLGAGQFIFTIEFSFRLTNGATPGDFAFHWAQNTSDAADTQIDAGSQIEYIQVD